MTTLTALNLIPMKCKICWIQPLRGQKTTPVRWITPGKLCLGQRGGRIRLLALRRVISLPSRRGRRTPLPPPVTFSVEALGRVLLPLCPSWALPLPFKPPQTWETSRSSRHWVTVGNNQRASKRITVRGRHGSVPLAPVASGMLGSPLRTSNQKWRITSPCPPWPPLPLLGWMRRMQGMETATLLP